MSETGDDPILGCMGKTRHITQGDAKKSISRKNSIHGTKMKVHAYFCVFCKGWHVGKSRFARKTIKYGYNRKQKHKGK